MKKFVHVITRIGLAASILVGCTSWAAPAPELKAVPAPCVGKTITLGEISDDPVEVIENTQLIAQYFAGHLKDFGIGCGKVKVYNNVDGMIDAINRGEVDIYWDSLFPITLVSDSVGARPILRRWRYCSSDYNSVIFTTSDSGINTIGDLKGHMIAMDRPDSTSGLALPAGYLVDSGLHLVVKEVYDDPVAEDETGITFTYDDENTIFLVLNGKVSAGAADDYWFKAASKNAPPEKQLVLLAETEFTMRQAVLLRPSLSSELQAAIKEILLKAPEDPQASEALRDAVGTCKFDEVPDEISASLEQMQALRSKMQSIAGWPEALAK